MVEFLNLILTVVQSEYFTFFNKISNVIFQIHTQILISTYESRVSNILKLRSPEQIIYTSRKSVKQPQKYLTMISVIIQCGIKFTYTLMAKHF